ncbi:Hypothetical predicted protein [Octopus vulgaris]|uniref:Uncharacterized protein n=1 Tax=Octopus vulgaris TaxID=6645 RepID=A0AA36AK58_OCTVU|nr:Hypothetical predicted protein [Octopus vulgaris]
MGSLMSKCNELRINCLSAYMKDDMIERYEREMKGEVKDFGIVIGNGKVRRLKRWRRRRSSVALSIVPYPFSYLHLQLVTRTDNTIEFPQIDLHKCLNVLKSVCNMSCKDVTQKDSRVLFWCASTCAFILVACSAEKQFTLIRVHLLDFPTHFYKTYFTGNFISKFSILHLIPSSQNGSCKE